MIYTYVGTIFISLLFIIINLDKQQAYWRLQKWFALFIGITFVIELIGLMMVLLKIKSIWLFNLFTPVEFVVYSLFYLTQIKLKIARTWIRWFLLIYPVVYVINILSFQHLFTAFHTNTYLLGSLFMILWSGTYFYDQIISETNLNSSLIRDPFFWISVGVLFFYSGCFIIFGAINYLNFADVKRSESLYMIVQLLNILMYSLFAIGFSCHKIFQKSYF